MKRQLILLFVSVLFFTSALEATNIDKIRSYFYSNKLDSAHACIDSAVISWG